MSEHVHLWRRLDWWHECRCGAITIEMPCCRTCCEPCREDPDYGYMECCHHAH